jgi:hypothetical protein
MNAAAIRGPVRTRLEMRDNSRREPYFGFLNISFVTRNS